MSPGTPRAGDKLTFGQAVSYVTGAVECLEIAAPEWRPFDPSVPVPPDVVANWQFRLKPRPKTRIEEMAEESWRDTPLGKLGGKAEDVAEFGKRVVQTCAGLVKGMAPNTRPIDAGNRLLSLLMGTDMPAGSPPGASR